SSPAAPVITQTGSAVAVVVGDFSVNFDKLTGLLNGIKSGDQIFSLTNGPRPAIGTMDLTRLSTGIFNGTAVVTARYSGNLKQVVWRIRSRNRMECDYIYQFRGTNDYFGVLFDYPESMVKAKRWIGDGPYRVWKNRREGVAFGFWENEYNNTITGWRDWIYPEFKGCFADVRWLQLDTTEGRITVEPHHVPFVQVLTPEFPPAKLGGHTIPSVPGCGLGFLDAIPPVGSKFQSADVVGPAGGFPAGRGAYHGSVVFQFGKLP
ncbi:MAG TPA: glycoside hydrolase family 2, partial [Candidatus Binatia bacterium]|nr:glycoside hydrolase family 2 [Candidatus Binatia bacterium]